MLTAGKLRETWISFFEKKGHAPRPPASLVPENDPTLLFTGAGMNQFKDLFLGRGTVPFRRAATVQRCLRAGDIDNVGRTLRHFTFFEMLGNFSFDDYFKDEAIPWGWEFSTAVLRIPAERIVVTIYLEDEESFRAWRKVGVPAERIFRFGAKDNFWPANAPEDGPNGPCGPCTEMYFDLRPEAPLPRQAVAEGVAELDSERFLEFWNLVFPQFERVGKNDLKPLGRRNVDTGAGLERMLAVVEGHGAPFHTSVIRPVVDAAAKVVGQKVYDPSAPHANRLRRIADHVRAASFCVADGVKPSNEGRGYVLRRILRRAIRDGILLQVDRPFLEELVPVVVATMKDGYPTLAEGEHAIRDALRGEEEQFRATYTKGLRYFEEELPRIRKGGVVPGPVAFRLHDTYGFPIDLLTQMATEEHGLSVDREGFEKELEGQRDRARKGSKLKGDIFAGGPIADLKSSGAAPTRFLGYDGAGTEGKGRVLGLVAGDRLAPHAESGQEVTVVLDQSPFYAEGGGQVGDVGELVTASGRVEVKDTQKAEGFHLHVGRVVSGRVEVGAEVEARVDRARRDAIRRNHTATHLLHRALKIVLGESARQEGSLVAPDRLRFDFSWPKALTEEQTRRIEELVNLWVLSNQEARTELLDLDAAKASGAVAMFGEKYDQKVRVLDVPGDETTVRSRELCGGTHVRRTGDIGAFRVTTEASIAAGVRRIEAVTGLGATGAFDADRRVLRELSDLLKAKPDELAVRVRALQEESRDLKKRAEAARLEQSLKEADRLAADARPIGGRRVQVAAVAGADGKALKEVWERLKKGGVEVALLVGESEAKAPVLAASTVPTVDARELLGAARGVLGGGGGGRPELAQGQGEDRTRVPEALVAVRKRIGEMLGDPAAAR